MGIDLAVSTDVRLFSNLEGLPREAVAGIYSITAEERRSRRAPQR